MVEKILHAAVQISEADTPSATRRFPKTFLSSFRAQTTSWWASARPRQRRSFLHLHSYWS